MRPVSFCLLLVLLAATSAAAIRRDPNGVNVSSPWPFARGAVLNDREASVVDRRVRPEPPPRKGPLPSRHSFTTLTNGPRQFEADPWAPANDEGDAEELALGSEGIPSITTQSTHPALEGLQRVAGADFGNAVHAIFEHHAKSVPIPEQMTLVQQQLAQNNVRHPDLDEARFASILADRLQGALNADLDSSPARRPGRRRVPESAASRRRGRPARRAP